MISSLQVVKQKVKSNDYFLVIKLDTSPFYFTDNIENEQITEPISEGVSKENLKEVEAVKVEIVEQVVEIVEQVVEKSEDIEDYDDKKIITKEPHRR